MRYRRSSALLLMLVIVGVVIGGSGVTAQGTRPYNVYMPLVRAPLARQIFGVDLSSWYTTSEGLGLMNDIAPIWVRAGWVLWKDVEPTPGEYHWEALAPLEQTIKQLREQGVEPVVIVHTPPSWARKYPGLTCSPPAPEYVGAYTRFLQALSARYKDGPSAIHYWEVGNEPDVNPPSMDVDNGVDCWGEPTGRYRGGDYYGQVLVQAAAALKSGNNNAKVLGGGLLYWLDVDLSRLFLEGMILTGGVDASDYLSFHAYGEWSNGDMLITKTNLVRAQLAKYGRQQKPLFATEVAAICSVPPNTSCDQSSDFMTNAQANYAARIAAEAIGLNLQGAFWFTLISPQPGFSYSQLVDFDANTVAPRRSYYALRNSARLLTGATYIGPTITDPTQDDPQKVQILAFRKQNTYMYVFWVQHTECLDCPVLYNLPVRPGSQARCTTNLDGQRWSSGVNTGDPYVYNCSDSKGKGSIPLAVGELPQYVEVLDQGASTMGFLP